MLYNDTQGSQQKDDIMIQMNASQSMMSDEPSQKHNESLMKPSVDKLKEELLRIQLKIQDCEARLAEIMQ